MSLLMGATLYGYAIDSDVPLPRARTGPAGRGTLRIRAPTSRCWSATAGWCDTTPSIWALARTEEGLLVWCPGTGSYHADARAG